MSTRTLFALVNILGGMAVLGSYAWCLVTYPEHRNALWGGVHGTLRSIFTLSMLLAAGGYITFCYVIIFQVGERTFGKNPVLGTNAIIILTTVFLASAAMWMPSLIAFYRSGEGHWWVVCTLSLWVTAISLILMTGVTAISHVDGISKASINASVAGLAYTTFHCLFLDAVVWVALYNK